LRHNGSFLIADSIVLNFVKGKELLQRLKELCLMIRAIILSTESIKRAAKEKSMLNNEKSHHTKIQSTFDCSDSGRYNDVEFSLSDGSKLKANKYILASQSEYFDTMFYGSIKHGRTVPLQWCSKTSMEKVLSFLSVGIVEIGDLEIMELLELLEASRLMCLENLDNFVEAHVKHYFDSSFNEKMSLVQVLMALDFALVKHFESITTWLLKFIDEHIKHIMKVVPEGVGVISANGMIILLGYEGSAKRMDRHTHILHRLEGSESGFRYRNCPVRQAGGTGSSGA